MIPPRSTFSLFVRYLKSSSLKSSAAVAFGRHNTKAKITRRISATCQRVGQSVSQSVKNRSVKNRPASQSVSESGKWKARTDPPTAIPTMAPVDSPEEEGAGGGGGGGGTTEAGGGGGAGGGGIAPQMSFGGRVVMALKEPVCSCSAHCGPWIAKAAVMSAQSDGHPRGLKRVNSDNKNINQFAPEGAHRKGQPAAGG
jgi:hypothetical protein